MRPVRLEMNGFASFRDHTVVDFADAEYFALTGSTGSGKSTVLDAITFALYGTAYRWGRSNGVADALAPTTNRCTVALTFDVGQHRYQVAREVRRSGTNITQRSPSLVRFADPTATVIDPDGPQPEVLAGDISEVRAAIIELLGLNFDDFCQCVVLPQGDFAKFLSATPGDRQNILLRLLGAAQYEGIRGRANAIAAQARDHVQIYSDQLLGYADATPEAEEAARAHVDALTDLQTEVDRAVPQIAASISRGHDADTAAQTLRSQLTLLRAVTAPEGVDELQRNAAAAESAAEAARTRSGEATTALTSASDAARSGPQRAVIEQARERYDERDQLQARRSTVETAASATEEQARDTETALGGTGDAVTAARHEHDQAQARHTAARSARDELVATRRLLADVRVPAGVGELADRAGTLDAAVVTAEEHRVAAHGRAEDAHAALSGAPSQDTLDAASRELATLDQTITALAAAHDQVTAAEATSEAAATAERVAQDAVEAALLERDHARLLAGAAQLRPQLQVGHECPVCTQQVTTLPPPLHDPALDALEETVTVAQQRHRDAASQRQHGEAALGEQRQLVATLVDRRDQCETRLTGLLPDRPAGTERDVAADLRWVGQQQTARAALVDAAQVADQARTAAETAHRQATAAAGVAAREVERARTVLATTCGIVKALDPPAVDVADLASAWAKLDGWARERDAGLAAQLDDAETELADAETRLGEATADIRDAEARHEQAQLAHTRAVKAAAEVAGERDTLLRRLGELDALLDAAPAAADLSDLLVECCRLEQAVEDASKAARAAGEESQRADAEHGRWQRAVAAARAELSAARDAVAALTPPSLDTTDVAAGWATLVTWAHQQAAAAAGDVERLTGEAATAAGEAQAATTSLIQRLVEHGLDPADLGEGADRAAQACRVVAVGLERAKGLRETIERDIAAAATLREKVEQASEKQVVAAELAGLLRSNRFPQWLANSALDSLVVGASASLRRLSGDQFDLTHHRGEFRVIDHADADSTRSVRTLSGGETFQASLALALALSDHLAGMGGSTKLESIFLDEGFGTLDPDSLEMVAETLETLAQGERVVGVITHVAELADRAPVRFQVRRNARTSLIERDLT